MPNLFKEIPNELPSEIFEDILSTPNIRIERILSHGHSSPEQGWYDQDENEWVLVLSGFGVIEFDDGRVITLNKGDYLNIKAHEKHKVQATAPNETTVWLAVFYR
ncbi:MULTISPECIES: cupin domain-containing protein [Aliivibrio]|uniref:cupin domain-containing protein n=1 Tax=Aliivibrio TaxID=511678 RepID=UPI00030C1C51|nr:MULTISPECIES: cupin domain-containing protein [Aliivibrio]MBD1569861.1 cupin domain-containing protein [Aliivibrio sp. S10_S31]MUH96445.1 cupin domain-containing protein [Aliivibrio fischeri]MUI63205.1 cupin domain-containing protein [Aliivibrio fischeri]OCH03873.1 cupin [Aliivibrio fischeri]OCH06365.1 cupin [Aliivibrio fischeri]